MTALTNTHLRKLEAAARAYRQSLVRAVENANHRPGLLGVATLRDAALAASRSANLWAEADDQARAGFVEEAVTRRVIDDAMLAVPIVARIPLGAIVTVAEMGLPTTWDAAYAAKVADLLRDLLEPMVDEHDSTTKYRRFDREIPMTPDGHIDFHESARQALRDRGLPADESAIAAILAAVEESC